MNEVGSKSMGGWRGLACVVVAATALASLPVAAAALTQGYHSDLALVAGTIVSLDTADSTKVTPTDVDHLDGLVGVVAATADATLAISSSGGNTNVATNGIVNVFVCDLNGEIKPGDRIAVSPLVGVGMKATTSVKVVGTAQSSFNSNTTGAVNQNIVDRNGHSKSVAVGSVPVLVGVSYYVASSATSSIVPQFLQDLANSIAGKPVSIMRVIGGAAVLLFGLIVITVLLYSTVRNSIISIGRNPLSQAAVYHGLLQVFLACLGIMMVALVATYILVSL